MTIVDKILRGGGDTRHGLAVGLGEGIEKEGRIVVLRPYGSAIPQIHTQQVQLIHMVAAGGITIHLLQQVEVGIGGAEQFADLGEVVHQARLAPCPRLGAAVHEETEVLFIGAKADVVGHDGILRVLLHHGKLRGFCIILCRQGHVANTVVSRQHIDHIADDEQQQQRHDTNEDLPAFLHFPAPPFTNFVKCSILYPRDFEKRYSP